MNTVERRVAEAGAHLVELPREDGHAELRRGRARGVVLEPRRREVHALRAVRGAPYDGLGRLAEERHLMAVGPERASAGPFLCDKDGSVGFHVNPRLAVYVDA